MYSPEYVRWQLLPTLKEMVNDPWYQTYLSASDPFFEETMTPFAPDIPFLVVGRGGNDLTFEPEGMPSLAERYRNMTLPRIRILQSWGWDVRVFQDESEDGTSYDGSPAQSWVLEQLARLIEEPIPQDSLSS